ncbi:hypothetical protein MJO29_012805 [Puccinia striiformis f. sp. tritici]|uniref:hypothetical protein n=1 Tax=Puccinia striiformis f. sp. tritici TaxID=168172 RepID=UPI002008C1C3|nr:hypothetical protein Pst134EA_024254 [Puccinia striiformis f. sp. tritici]KAH9444685.1 hypothetical protein Pst134EB_024942 [Puccinia striiformis f. sp. tritici]KAH9453377.1 hypothetical protein Pst134EA_024254 [Puccinia striiformis f. sp. tritici]KAI7942961.1 hypothetical protein MJO29_012805 [Puccinia striiformis f. sp. tritici]
MAVFSALDVVLIALYLLASVVKVDSRPTTSHQGVTLHRPDGLIARQLTSICLEDANSLGCQLTPSLAPGSNVSKSHNDGPGADSASSPLEVNVDAVVRYRPAESGSTAMQYHPKVQLDAPISTHTAGLLESSRSTPPTAPGLVSPVSVGFGEGPTHNLGKEPTSNLGKGPTSNLGKGPTSNLGKEPTSNLDKDPTSDPGKEPTSNLGEGPTADLGKGPTSSLGAPVTGPSSQTMKRPKDPEPGSADPSHVSMCLWDRNAAGCEGWYTL